jgi:hypothetical protein
MPRDDRMSSDPSSARRVTAVAAAVVESYLGRFLLWIVMVLLVVTIYSRQTAPASEWTARDWSALAALVTAAIALLALVIASYHWHEVRALRREEAAPYVVALLEPDRADPRIVHLVIRNLGTTVAHGVRVSVTPRPVRSDGVGGGDLPYPSELPSLAPGQEQRTFWDFGPWRYQQRDQLGARHRVHIDYADFRGQPHRSDSSLDWAALMLGPGWVGRHSMDDLDRHIESVERSLRQIAGAVGAPPTAVGQGSTAGRVER